MSVFVRNSGFNNGVSSILGENRTSGNRRQSGGNRRQKSGIARNGVFQPCQVSVLLSREPFEISVLGVGLPGLATSFPCACP